jgi:hypothetical protein
MSNQRLEAGQTSADKAEHLVLTEEFDPGSE